MKLSLPWRRLAPLRAPGCLGARATGPGDDDDEDDEAPIGDPPDDDEGDDWDDDDDDEEDEEPLQAADIALQHATDAAARHNAARPPVREPWSWIRMSSASGSASNVSTGLLIPDT